MLKQESFSKKIINITLILLVVMSLCGCKNETKESSEEPSTTVSLPTSTTTSITTSTSTISKTTKTTTTTEKCTPKKFDHPYTYVYETEEECKKKYETNIFDVMNDVNSEVFAGNYRKITDDCGKTWYGVYFYTYDDKNSKEVEWYY